MVNYTYNRRSDMKRADFTRKRINLRKKYEDEISGWGWDSIEVNENCVFDLDSNRIIDRIYVGSQLCIYPSGKIYSAWTTNQRVRDVVCDALFDEVLHEIAEARGYWVEVTDGDVFLGRIVEVDSWEEFDDLNWITSDDEKYAREYITENELL